MTDKQDIITQIESLQKANAQAFALSDIAELIYKYEEKLNRQYTDAKRKYERLKKSGSSVNAMHDALNKQSILHYQMLAAAEARLTLAKQAEEALLKLKEVQKEFGAFGKQVLEEEKTKG